jgi:hypothetical protein
MGFFKYILTRRRRGQHHDEEISLTPLIVEPSFVDEGLVEAMKDFLAEESRAVGCPACHAELIVYGRRPEHCEHHQKGNT